MERAPPKLALWLLKHLGSPYHRESLAGDLIEQCREGRSRAWCWRQAVTAIVLARARFLRVLPWAAFGRGLSFVLAETAAVLAIVVVVDHGRHAHAVVEPMDSTFIGMVLGLIAVACAGFLASAWRRESRLGRAATKALLLAFGVLALGVGTLTWALTAP